MTLYGVKNLCLYSFQNKKSKFFNSGSDYLDNTQNLMVLMSCITILQRHHSAVLEDVKTDRSDLCLLSVADEEKSTAAMDENNCGEFWEQ